MVSTERWNQELKNAGFTGAETILYDDEKPYRNQANILARPAIRDKCSKTVSLLCAKSTDSAFAELSTVLESRGYDVEIVKYPQIHSAQDINSIVDLDETFFTTIDAAKLKSFQDLVMHLQIENVGMFWVSRVSQILCRDLRYAQVIGAARTVRSEMGVALATLELDSVSSDNWGHVVDVFSKFQRRAKEEEMDSDMEFAVADNVIHISRFHSISVKKELSGGCSSIFQEARIRKERTD